MSGHPGIALPQQRPDARRFCAPGKRNRPPNGLRYKNQCVCSAVHLTCRRQHEHFCRWICHLHVQTFGQPGRLQRRDIEAPARQRCFPAFGPGAAAWALGIVENPTAQVLNISYFCNFCIQRNPRSKKIPLNPCSRLIQPFADSIAHLHELKHRCCRQFAHLVIPAAHRFEKIAYLHQPLPRISILAA